MWVPCGSHTHVRHLVELLVKFLRPLAFLKKIYIYKKGHKITIFVKQRKYHQQGLYLCLGNWCRTIFPLELQQNLQKILLPSVVDRLHFHLCINHRIKNPLYIDDYLLHLPFHSLQIKTHQPRKKIRQAGLPQQHHHLRCHRSKLSSNTTINLLLNIKCAPPQHAQNNCWKNGLIN